MIEELDLTGNELICFALIHTHTKNGVRKLKMSLNDTTKMINCSKTTAIKLLKSLMKKGFIKRRRRILNGSIITYYWSVFHDLENKTIYTKDGIYQFFSSRKKPYRID